MTNDEIDFEAQGEVIKLIHGELPAVRWTCGKCGEDTCTIFFEPEITEELVECETCSSVTLVRKGD